MAADTAMIKAPRKATRIFCRAALLSPVGGRQKSSSTSPKRSFAPSGTSTGWVPIGLPFRKVPLADSRSRSM
jgi:hypothetical protein